MPACNKCGNTVVVEPGVIFARCFSCHTTHFVSGTDQLITCHRIRAKFSATEALEFMRQWLEQSGVQGVAVIDQARAFDAQFWSFLVPAPAGTDTHLMVPANSLPLPELAQFGWPAQVLAVNAASAEPDSQDTPPELPREDAWSLTRSSAPLETVRVCLMRVPLYEFPYTYEGRSYRVLVDGMTGRCMSARTPRRRPTLMGALLVAGVLAFVTEGWVLWGQGTSLALGFVLTAVATGAVTFLLARRAKFRDRS